MNIGECELIKTTEEELKNKIMKLDDIDTNKIYKINDKYITFRKNFYSVTVEMFLELKKANDEYILDKQIIEYYYYCVNSIKKYHGYHDKFLLKRTTYMMNNMVTRNDGPAIIEYYNSGKIKSKKWIMDNKYHRIDGPAIINYDMEGNIIGELYFINDIQFKAEKWLNFITSIKNGSKTVETIKNKNLLDAVEMTAKYYDNQKILERVIVRKTILALT